MSRLTGRKKKVDPNKKVSSPAKKQGKSYVKTKSGGRLKVSKKSVEDARSGTGAFKKAAPYKGRVVKGKSGKMSGIIKDDGSYTRTTNPVARKKAKAALAKDKKLHSKSANTRTKRNTRFKKAKPVGS